MNKNSIILILLSTFSISILPMERGVYLEPEKPVFELTREESDFIWFSSQNNLEKVKELAGVVQNIDIKDKRGSTALHWAAYRGNVNIVNFLLSRGAQVDIRDKTRKTPLQWAAGHGHYDITTLLLNYNADPDLSDEKGDTALHWSTFNFHNDIVEKLVENNAEINCQNNEGITPLNTSLIVGNMPAAKLFLDKNAEFLSDKQKRNPIHCAVWGNNYDCLKAVIEALPAEKKSSLINGQDRQGETALHYAAMQSAGGKMAFLLIKHGAQVNIKCYMKERTPLHVCMRNHKGSLIHAESIDQYRQKYSNRLSTAQVLNFIVALKTAPDLDTNMLDYQGLSVYDFIEKTRFDTQQEKDALKDVLSAPNNGALNGF